MVTGKRSVMILTLVFLNACSSTYRKQRKSAICAPSQKLGLSQSDVQQLPEFGISEAEEETLEAFVDGLVEKQIAEGERIVSPSIGPILQCYRHLLREKPDATGKILLFVTFNRDGTEKSAVPIINTLASDEVLRCVKQEARSWNSSVSDEEEMVPHAFCFHPQTEDLSCRKNLPLSK